MSLTVELYAQEVAELLVRVLQEDTVVSVGLEVEGDVSAGARFEGRECDVGGLDEGYGVPDVSCERDTRASLINQCWKINVIFYPLINVWYLRSPWQRRGPTVY